MGAKTPNGSCIRLVLLGTSEIGTWPLGGAGRIDDPSPANVAKYVDQHRNGADEAAWLFWDSSLGLPDPHMMNSLLQSPDDVWHAGLKMGMAGKPELLNFVKPTWMLNKDPDPTIECTSWRMSLGACLIRTSVLQTLGGPMPQFDSLEIAALELGHRYITHGAFVRHIPSIVQSASEANHRISFIDELRFIGSRFGRRWTGWALFRAAWTRHASPASIVEAVRTIERTEPRLEIAPYRRAVQSNEQNVSEGTRVSVLIPTLERYNYLQTLLEQLRHQTMPPEYIIIIDQTPPDERRPELLREFEDLPLTLLYQDNPGQCSSRNLGLAAVRTDYVLFLDDDDEIGSTLIEDHMRTMRNFEADVCSGVADEVGAGPLPFDFTYRRISDVFPTNNTLASIGVLMKSGLFDLAYERRARADGDLGMRIYLAGARMMLEPDIRVLHHHAPRGGLRKHGARVITYASSRKRLTHRHLPSPSEIYLGLRYFSRNQVREMLWLRVAGTFTVRGSRALKISKVVVGLLSLPNTLHDIRAGTETAHRMLSEFPVIPTLQHQHA